MILRVLTNSRFLISYTLMKEKNITKIMKNLFFNAIPPFYLTVMVLSALSCLAVLMPPYIHHKTKAYKTELERGVMKLGDMSKELERYITENDFMKDLIATDRALEKSAGKSLTKEDRRNLAEIITREARSYDIDPILIVALIYTESRFKTNALSVKGAKGLMQLLPGTAEYVSLKIGEDILKIANLYDVETNLKLGVAYLNYLIKKTGGNLEYARAAYNMGPANLYRALARNKIPSSYSSKVLKKYEELSKAVKDTGLAYNG